MSLMFTPELYQIIIELSEPYYYGDIKYEALDFYILARNEDEAITSLRGVDWGQFSSCDEGFEKFENGEYSIKIIHGQDEVPNEVLGHIPYGQVVDDYDSPYWEITLYDYFNGQL